MPDDSKPRPKPTGGGGGGGGGRPSGGNRRRRRRPGGAQRSAPQSRSGGARPRQQGGRSRSGAAVPERSTRAAAATVADAPSSESVAAAVVGSDPAAAELAEAAARNGRRAVAIAAAPALILFVVVAAIGAGLSVPLVGVVLGAVLAVVAGTVLWRFARRIVLAALGARLVDEDAAPGPSTQVEGLCATMGLPLPSLYLVDEVVPNALAVGRGSQDSALVLTTGLIDSLDPVELEGVLAHELAHVKRRDTAPATVASAVAIVTGLPASSAAGMVHRLAGRGREFEADRHAVRVTRYPPGLRQALATMVEAGGEVPADAGHRRAAVLTRWLRTVAPPVRDGRRAQEQSIGELDAPEVRIAALDEW